MKYSYRLLPVLCMISLSASAQQSDVKANFWHPSPHHYEVIHAIEVESLVPMFFTGGYHIAVGYRYKRFRIRASVINGGTYDAEKAGIKNSSPEFKRYYTTSPGVFFGYNLWKNLELYTYLEFHTFKITQPNTGDKQNVTSIDTGLGISYQFFIGQILYIQPGVHLYLRSDHSPTSMVQRITPRMPIYLL
jgi:hypothetical protein